MKSRKLKYEAVESYPEEDIEVEISKRKTFTKPCLWSAFSTVLLILIYFIPSIGLTFYQRWLLQKFHFPLSVVVVHLIVKFLLASFIRSLISWRQGKPRVLLGWKEYVIAVAPMGIFSGIDIGFSNWGLELVTISLYTMTKSTTIIFILAFAILFKLEKKSWSLSIIVVMISVGLLLFTYEATQFDLLGFFLVLFASMSSGVRWTCVQLLLQKSKMGMENPIDMIYHMQPWMIVSLLPFVIWMEGLPLIENCQMFRYTDYTVLLHLIVKVLLGALLAFFMEVTEVMVVTYTSSLTLSIAGIFKELFILFLAVEWNGDRISFINVIGLFICIGGITLHVIHKIKTIPMQNSSNFYDVENERMELSDSLIDNTAERLSLTDSEEEHSDTQVLFNILNRHDR